MQLPNSDDDYLLLHNPGCSKSRKVKALLEARGIDFSERRYLEEPLSFAELEELHTRLERSPKEWVRRSEAAFEESGVSPDADDEELLRAVAEHPILLERPIVVRGKRAVVGRPPEEVQSLL